MSSTSQNTPPPSPPPMTKLQTGCPKIDEMLGGGVKIGEITEICGETGIGKTQFCLQLVLSSLTWLASQGVSSNIIYLASHMAFSAGRLRKISEQFTRDETVAVDVLVRDVDYPEEVTDVLCDIRDMCQANVNNPKKTYMVVIDSIATLFSRSSASVAELEERTNRVKSTGFGLLRLAQKYGFVVVVCNQVVTAYDVTWI